MTEQNTLLHCFRPVTYTCKQHLLFVLSHYICSDQLKASMRLVRCRLQSFADINVASQFYHLSSIDEITFRVRAVLT